MSGQVLLRGDLASQSPSPLQSWRALLYPRIRQCLAKPLCGLALYLKQKADLAPVAFSLSPSLSVCLSTCLSVHLSTCLSTCQSVSALRFSIHLCTCHFSLPLCLHNSSIIHFLIPHFAFFILSSTTVSLPTHTHTPLQHHYSNASA